MEWRVHQSPRERRPRLDPSPAELKRTGSERRLGPIASFGCPAKSGRDRPDTGKPSEPGTSVRGIMEACRSRHARDGAAAWQLFDFRWLARPIGDANSMRFSPCQQSTVRRISKQLESQNWALASPDLGKWKGAAAMWDSRANAAGLEVGLIQPATQDKVDAAPLVPAGHAHARRRICSMAISIAWSSGRVSRKIALISYRPRQGDQPRPCGAGERKNSTLGSEIE